MEGRKKEWKRSERQEKGRAQGKGIGKEGRGGNRRGREWEGRGEKGREHLGSGYTARAYQQVQVWLKGQWSSKEG